MFLRRKRECFNGHSFLTYEVTSAVLDRRQIEAAKRGMKTRMLAESRKKAVLRSPTESSSALAARLKITDARVRQIRAEQKKAQAT